MNSNGDNELGARIRELRSWRQLSLRVAAQLAGVSHGWLGKVERGEEAVNSRRTLERIAQALQVAPEEIVGKPWRPSSTMEAEAQAGIVEIERALEYLDLDDDPGGDVRPWPEISADVARLAGLVHGTSDYAQQVQLTPALLRELHAVHARDPQLRRQALRGLITGYSSAMWSTKRLGGRGLPSLAARAVVRCARELENPAWLGYAAWLRADATGQLDRHVHYTRVTAAADELTAHLDNQDALQAAGMLHLSASLAAGADGDHATAGTHLDEATDLARRMHDQVGNFGNLWFGTANVDVWRASLAVEMGDHGRAIATATSAHPEVLPTSRQAEFFADVGRALVTDKRTRERGVKVLIQAEKLSPQRVRQDLFVREAVTNLLGTARRDAGGRDLRGLAWRMGIAPIG